MSISDHERDSVGQSSNWAGDAEPYRTPGAIPDPTPKRGVLASPVAWLIAGAVVAGAIAFLFAFQRVEPRPGEYFQDFGGASRIPPEDIREYGRAMQAAEASQE